MIPEPVSLMSKLGIDDTFLSTLSLPLWPHLLPVLSYEPRTSATWPFLGPWQSLSKQCAFCLCLSLFIPLSCILSLVNAYLSFKSQLPRVLLCHTFLIFPRKHHFILWAPTVFVHISVKMLPKVFWKISVCNSLPLHLPSSTTIPLFVHLLTHSRNTNWEPTMCQVLF